MYGRIVENGGEVQHKPIFCNLLSICKYYYTICTIEYFLGLITAKYLSKSTQSII